MSTPHYLIIKIVLISYATRVCSDQSERGSYKKLTKFVTDRGPAEMSKSGAELRS